MDKSVQVPAFAKLGLSVMYYNTLQRSMIKAIIFDLDMCILDAHTLVGSFFNPVLDALNNSELPAELKKRISDQLWITSLDDTAEMFSIPEDVAEKMREAYRKIEVPAEALGSMKSFGDEKCIQYLPVKRFLVTSGYRKFQETKIAHLGIVDLFDEIIIDALDFRDKRKGKRNIFREILEKNNWIKDNVLVVGDNPMSELGAAKSLGIPTVQILRPTIVKWDGATHHINSLVELKALIQ